MTLGREVRTIFGTRIEQYIFLFYLYLPKILMHHDSCVSWAMELWLLSFDAREAIVESDSCNVLHIQCVSFFWHFMTFPRNPLRRYGIHARKKENSNGILSKMAHLFRFYVGFMVMGSRYMIQVSYSLHFHSFLFYLRFCFSLVAIIGI